MHFAHFPRRPCSLVFIIHMIIHHHNHHNHLCEHLNIRKNLNCIKSIMTKASEQPKSLCSICNHMLNDVVEGISNNASCLVGMQKERIGIFIFLPLQVMNHNKSKQDENSYLVHKKSKTWEYFAPMLTRSVYLPRFNLTKQGLFWVRRWGQFCQSHICTDIFIPGCLITRILPIWWLNYALKDS